MSQRLPTTPVVEDAKISETLEWERRYLTPRVAAPVSSFFSPVRSSVAPTPTSSPINKYSELQDYIEKLLQDELKDVKEQKDHLAAQKEKTEQLEREKKDLGVAELALQESNNRRGNRCIELKREVPARGELRRNVIDRRKNITALENSIVSKIDYLQRVHKWREEIYSLDELKDAVQHFLQLKEFQKKMNIIRQDVRNSSILNNELPVSFDAKVMSECKKFQDYVFTYKFSHARDQIENVKIAFTHLEVLKNHTKILYSAEYRSLTTKKRPAGEKVDPSDILLSQIMELFSDYSKKWYCHWRRKHYPSADRIYTQLGRILKSVDDPHNKISAAKDYILNELNTIFSDKDEKGDETKKHPFYKKQQSSFGRRAYYALELLDKASIESVSTYGLGLR